MPIIFNADDYGYSKGVNLGIIEAANHGVVTSATMLANMPGFEHGVRLLATSELKIGVHLCLTTGPSLGGVYRTLTDDQGHFVSQTTLLERANAGQVDLAEVEKEYTLQIEKIRQAGVNITHMDGHHHNQNWPGLIDVFLKLANKYQVAVRLDDPDRRQAYPQYTDLKAPLFDGSFFGDNLTHAHIEHLATTYTQPVEIMCHPAYVDAYLLANSRYNIQRTQELAILTSQRTRDILASHGMVCISYADL